MRFLKRPLLALSLATLSCISTRPAPAQPPSAEPAPYVHRPAALLDPPAAEVAIQSGPYRLRGYLVKPKGEGPFPAVVYNHGSERAVDFTHFGALAGWWQANGYVVLFPFRRGAGGSEGPYWREGLDDLDTESAQRTAMEQVERENDDVVAALEWLSRQASIDPKRIAVAGCSFGGVQTMIAAARASPARAALDFAGGSMTWARWAPMRERMTAAAREAKVPVYLLQAENDFDTTEQGGTHD